MSKAQGSLKGEVYRQARLWHGWISAAAFLALMFFAATGLLLNNEDWLKAKPVEATQNLTFTPAELASAKGDRDLAEIAVKRLTLRGEPQKSRPGDKPHVIKVRGVSAASEIAIDRQAGTASIKTERLGPVATLKNLHKGKNAGPAWHLLIDAAAITVLTLSLIGYFLFFTLRFRIRTGLILTSLTLAAGVGLFLFSVP